MNNKKIKLKTKLLISCILGIIGIIIAFPLMWDNRYGNTPEEIKQVEITIKKITQKPTELDFLPDWDPDWNEIEKITEPLVYENERIAKAKALLYYKENPMPEKKLRLLFDDLWRERHIIRKQDWKIQTTTSRILISSGVAILTGIGTILCVFLLLTIIPYFWCFLLQRINELSRAIQGKINS